MAQSGADQSIHGLLVINGHNYHHFIQNIFKHFNHTSDEELKPKTLDLGTNEDIDSYDLTIDNKYYSAEIYLFDLKDKQIISKRLTDCVEGVIIYFDLDLNEESSAAGLESWKTFTDQFNNEIKLLVCDQIDCIPPEKSETLMKWCLDNEFELVELCPRDVSHEDDDEVEDPFQEDGDGFTRISQAIQAYNWPNSSLKDSPQYNPSPKFKDLLDKEVFGSIGDTNEVKETDNELEDFEHLFEKFNQMKLKSSQMNETDRRHYAEEVTLAFWRAIGGDEQEIEGLDSTLQ